MSFYIRKNGQTKRLNVMPDAFPATGVSYNDTNTQLGANNTQTAIEKLIRKLGTIEVNVENISTLPVTIPAVGITAQHKLTYYYTNNDAMANLIVTTGTDNITISGNVSGTTNLYMLFTIPILTINVDLDS